MKDVTLRHITLADEPGIVTYITDPEATKYLTWNAYQKNDPAIHAYVERVSGKTSYPDESLAIIYAGKTIGTIHVIARDERFIQFGFGISRQYWHRGIGTQAAAQAVAYLKRSSWQGKTTEIWADVHKDNRYAIRILEKLGFSLQQENIEQHRNRYTLPMEGDI